MASVDKILEKESVIETSEQRYTTLDNIDLTDIAQAIDGGRSKPKEEPNYKIDPERNLKTTKKFWLW